MSEFKKQHYTMGQRLAGEDLHGLPCRIPEPEGKEKDCPHSQDGRTTFEDVEDTHIMKCTKCGYMRRY